MCLPDALAGRDFLGGSAPNLADLSVFGATRSITGTDTFMCVHLLLSVLTLPQGPVLTDLAHCWRGIWCSACVAHLAQGPHAQWRHRLQPVVRAHDGSRRQQLPTASLSACSVVLAVLMPML